MAFGYIKLVANFVNAGESHKIFSKSITSISAGISFNDYVNRYRISKACYILGNSECSILRCAMDCGYNSLRSFNRNFMELAGVTPKQFRSNKE